MFSVADFDNTSFLARSFNINKPIKMPKSMKVTRQFLENRSSR